MEKVNNKNKRHDYSTDALDCFQFRILRLFILSRILLTEILLFGKITAKTSYRFTQLTRTEEKSYRPVKEIHIGEVYSLE